MASPERARPAHEVAAEARLDSLLAELGGLLKAAIRRLCPRSLGVQTDEIEQEVRIRLWQALRDERNLTSPSSYTRRIAVNAVIDAVRQVRSRREESLHPAEAGSEGQPQLAAAEPSPFEQVAGGETAELVERGLQRLEPSRGRAVRLYLQGFGSQEIADLSGWTEPKARNLLYRGLEDLRRELRANGLDLEAR